MTLLLARPRPRFRMSLALVALSAFGLTASLSAVASAQGRCSCNRGCHQFPGQCVQAGSAGCESGFAPFCGTRPTTCPNASWVSCSGECTCVRVAPVDAGVSDAGRPDVSLPTDVLASMDVPAAQDVGRSVDVGTTVDVPGRDALPMDVRGADATTSASDAPVATFDGAVPALDASPHMDATASPSDATAAGDDGCVCVGGVCIAGVCYRERCAYNPELGFTCATRGTNCRLVGGDPYCVPLCAGVICAAGEFCDERSNGACMVDRCASIVCPVGTTCVYNQCGRWSGADGGVFVTEDGGGVRADGGATAPQTATETGCGCRVGEQSGGDGRWGISAVMLALLGLGRRRRARRAAR